MSYRRTTTPPSKPIRRKNDGPTKPTIQEQITGIPVAQVVAIGLLTAIAGAGGTALFSWVRGAIKESKEAKLQAELEVERAKTAAAVATAAAPAAPPAQETPVLMPYDGIYRPREVAPPRLPGAPTSTPSPSEPPPPVPSMTPAPARSVEDLQRLERNLIAWQERLRLEQERLQREATELAAARQQGAA